MRCLLFALLLTVTSLATLALAQAPLAATDITVRGLEDTIKALSGMKDNRSAAQASLVLMLLKGLGRPSKGEDGRSRLDYQLQIGQDGKVLVNGIDIVPLLEATVKKH